MTVVARAEVTASSRNDSRPRSVFADNVKARRLAVAAQREDAPEIASRPARRAMGGWTMPAPEDVVGPSSRWNDLLRLANTWGGNEGAFGATCRTTRHLVSAAPCGGVNISS